jgi:hypothetical protein
MVNMSKYAEVSELIGKTMACVVNHGDDEIVFTTVDGEVFKMYHVQDCCEWVRVEDTCGDLQNLVGAPILMAECAVNEEASGYDSMTWTFYKFATLKGYVTIRWCGESNGYYSESVDFVRLTSPSAAQEAA